MKSNIKIILGVVAGLVFLGYSYVTYNQNQRRREEILKTTPWNEPVPSKKPEPKKIWKDFNTTVGLSFRYPDTWKLSLKEDTPQALNMEMVQTVDGKNTEERIVIKVNKKGGKPFAEEPKYKLSLTSRIYDIYVCSTCSEPFWAAVLQEGERQFIFQIFNRQELGKEEEDILKVAHF